MKIVFYDRIKGIGFGLLVTVCAFVIVSVFKYPGGMAPMYLAPYLSGAENISFGGDFLINKSECIAYENLSEADRALFKFSKTNEDNLTEYRFNEIGFVYFIKMAKICFPHQSSLTAILIFQGSCSSYFMFCISVLFQK